MAAQLYSSRALQGLRPNAAALATVLRACADLRDGSTVEEAWRLLGGPAYERPGARQVTPAVRAALVAACAACDLEGGGGGGAAAEVSLQIV